MFNKSIVGNFIIQLLEEIKQNINSRILTVSNNRMVIISTTTGLKIIITSFAEIQKGSVNNDDNIVVEINDVEKEKLEQAVNKIRTEYLNILRELTKIYVVYYSDSILKEYINNKFGDSDEFWGYLSRITQPLGCDISNLSNGDREYLLFLLTLIEESLLVKDNEFVHKKINTTITTIEYLHPLWNQQIFARSLFYKTEKREYSDIIFLLLYFAILRLARVLLLINAWKKLVEEGEYDSSSTPRSLSIYLFRNGRGTTAKTLIEFIKGESTEWDFAYSDRGIEDILQQSGCNSRLNDIYLLFKIVNGREVQLNTEVAIEIIEMFNELLSEH